MALLSKTENSTNVSPESLKISLDDISRYTFFWLLIITVIVALGSNLFVIYSTCYRRNFRYVQKTSIITLALSDILTTVMTAVNHLTMLSNPLVNWNLGEFLCHFIPMGTMIGLEVSSFALVMIALDRYQNVVQHASGKRWNPPLTHCVLAALAIWATSTGIAYPIWPNYQHMPIRIVYKTPPKYEDTFMCITFVKEYYCTYYIVMSCAIFLPLTLIFTWLNYKIAELIWKHRKPMFYKENNEESSSNINYHINQNKIIPQKKTKDVRVERKKRTFYIIVTLILVFVVCRLPYHLLNFMKFCNKYTGKYIWTIQYFLIWLNNLNCALNPFLYTYLNQTIKTIRKIQHFTMEICCCCFSSADFEENPFVEQKSKPDEPNNSVRNPRVKFDVEEKY